MTGLLQTLENLETLEKPWNRIFPWKNPGKLSKCPGIIKKPWNFGP